VVWEIAQTRANSAGFLPHSMTALGAGLYVSVIRLLALSVRPFLPDRSTYNDVGRLPYYAYYSSGIRRIIGPHVG
jgi:hypothetical protein